MGILIIATSETGEIPHGFKRNIEVQTVEFETVWVELINKHKRIFYVVVHIDILILTQ